MHKSGFGSIGHIRHKRGITQQALADMVGVTREHLSAIENNRETPSVSLLERIASVLGVTVAELIGEAGTEQAAALERGRQERTA